VCFKLRQITFTKRTLIKGAEEQSAGKIFRIKQLEQHKHRDGAGKMKFHYLTTDIDSNRKCKMQHICVKFKT